MKRHFGFGLVVLVAVITLAVVVTLRATWSSAGQFPAVPTDWGIAALVDEEIVSIDDVDERWRQTNPSSHAEVMQTLYESRKAALDSLVGDRLIERAVTRAGDSGDAAAEPAISSRARPVTDDDVLAFYASNRDQLEGRTFEELQPAIRQRLEMRERARARREYVNELAQLGPPVRILLDPPRRSIEVGSDDPSVGSERAPVTLVAFSDFQCPFCARVEPTLKQVRDVYGDRVRLVWKDFPLTTIHADAFKAAEASHCAAEQEKYWPYHDRLFANQGTLTPEALKQYARDVGLDVRSFTACLDSSKYQARVQEGLDTGAMLGVESTPTIFINGRVVSGAQPFETFAALVDEELAREAAK